MMVFELLRQRVRPQTDVLPPDRCPGCAGTVFACTSDVTAESALVS